MVQFTVLWLLNWTQTANLTQQSALPAEPQPLKHSEAPVSFQLETVGTFPGRHHAMADYGQDVSTSIEILSHRKPCHEAQGPRLCVDVNARGGLVSRALPTFTVASAFRNSAL